MSSARGIAFQRSISASLAVTRARARVSSDSTRRSSSVSKGWPAFTWSPTSTSTRVTRPGSGGAISTTRCSGSMNPSAATPWLKGFTLGGRDRGTSGGVARVRATA
ncbi:MAG: hypothetical protein HUU18_08015 [Phycisphaerales bacterium]|nr:hypothetical protein [Phycisphaerales bacterium]